MGRRGTLTEGEYVITMTACGAVALSTAMTLAGCGVGPQGPGESDALRGTVTDVSDVAGIPDKPADGISIAAIPAEAVPDVFAEVAPVRLEENRLPALLAPVLRDARSAQTRFLSLGRFRQHR